MNPLLDWAVFTFDEITKRINKYTNLDTSFIDLPTRGVITPVQVFDDVDGTRAWYLIEPADFYIFSNSLQMWSGSNAANISYRKSLGIVLDAEVEGYWIPDPWYRHVINVIRADSDFANSLDRASMSSEHQQQFDAAVVVAGRAQDSRIAQLEDVITAAGIPIPLEVHS